MTPLSLSVVATFGTFPAEAKQTKPRPFYTIFKELKGRLVQGKKESGHKFKVQSYPVNGNYPLKSTEIW